VTLVLTPVTADDPGGPDGVVNRLAEILADALIHDIQCHPIIASGDR
jgi:hypothetical protein